MNASVLTALYGTDEALPLEVELRAGPLSMTLRGSHIVDLEVAGCEVWLGVTFLYRDPDWGTPRRCSSVPCVWLKVKASRCDSKVTSPRNRPLTCCLRCTATRKAQ